MIKRLLSMLPAWAKADIYAPKGPSANVRRPFDAASVTQLNANWQPSHYSGNSAISESWDLLTSRVRDLIRNEPTLRRARNQLARLVIGTGIQTFSDVESLELEHNEQLEQFANESDAWFTHWAENEADVRGQLSWYEIQDQLFRETVEVGNSLLVRCHRRQPGRSVPLCYQLVEFEQLDRTMDREAAPGRNKIVQGIEIDSIGRPVNYWIYDAHPYDYHYEGASTKSRPVPAERVLHYFIPDRVSSTCGISWFASLVRAVKDQDWYLANELQAAAIGALLTLIYKSERGAGMAGLDDGTGETHDDRGNPLVQLGHAITAEIGLDEEITVAESKRPNRNADPFISLLQRIQAMGSDLSYIRLTGDLKQTSYTAARAAHLDDQAMAAPLQNSVATRIALPVRRQHNRQAAAVGLYESISAREFQRNEHRYQLIKAQPVGREQLDPIKETTAANERLRTSVSTLQEEIGKRGGHWKRNLRQRRREFDYAARLGLQLDFSKGNGGNIDQQSEPDDNDQQAAQTAAQE